MGNTYLSNTGVFLIETIFGIFMLLFMLRLIMQFVRADFYNPVAQFIVKVTNPLLKPLRKFIPGLFGVDMASVLILFLLQMLEIFLVTLIVGTAIQPVGLAMLSVTKLFGLLLNVYIFGILIQVILSWVSPGNHNPVTSILYSINEPLLRPARKLIPPISGFDLSPIVVMVGLQVVSMLVLAPLTDFSRTLL